MKQYSFKTSHTHSLDTCQFHDQVQQKQPEQTNKEGLFHGLTPRPPLERSGSCNMHDI